MLIRQNYKGRGAFNRDGVNAGLSGFYDAMPYLKSVEIGSSSISFASVRVNFTALGAGSAFSNTLCAWGSGSDGWGLSCYATGVILYTQGGNSGTQAVTVNTDTWYHFLGVFDQANNTIRIYMDGVHIYSNTAYTDNSTDTTGIIRIGSNNSGGSNSDAKFGDILIGDGDISAAKAYALYKGVNPEKVVGRKNIKAYVPCHGGKLNEIYGRFKDNEWTHSGYTPVAYNGNLYKEHSISALPIREQFINITVPAVGGGRIMGSLANKGGLAGHGGIAGIGGGLAG